MTRARSLLHSGHSSPPRRAAQEPPGSMGFSNGQDRRPVAVVVTSDGRRVNVPLDELEPDAAPYPSGPFSSPFLAFWALLAAPGRSLEDGGRSARRDERTEHQGPRRETGGGFCMSGEVARRPRRGRRRRKGGHERWRRRRARGPASPAGPPTGHDRRAARAGRRTPARPTRSRRPRPRARSPRRSHVPGAGTAAAEAVEKARREMLHEGSRARAEAAERREKRARIGADVVVEAILRQGVDVLFGYPGGVILPLYDVLGDHPDLRHVLVRHEQGAAHAADGYARATGKVGVCLGTSGPAATNLVTGIATAQLDSDPDGRDHRQRPRRPPRQGRLPGDRHHRHHPADDEAQLPRPRRQRPPPRPRRGLLHRPDRAARARSTSTSRRTPSSRRRTRRTRPTRRSRPACRASARPSAAIPASSS